MPVAFIAGIDSVIGRQLAQDLVESHWRVLGSTRREKSLLNESYYYCDFSIDESVDACARQLDFDDQKIDLLVICVGVLQPIGFFGNTTFADWDRGFKINAINPLRFIHGILSSFLLNEDALVLTFAGGGINSAPTHYSSYTISKVALMKSMEILASEYPRFRFVSLGTGWINSPIHEQTLAAGVEAGRNLAELYRRLENNDFQPVESVSDFVFWVYQQNGEAISGRNFSLANDPWGDANLTEKLLQDFNKYKLRRFGND